MNQSGIVGRIVSLEDNFWQNNIDIDLYAERNKSLEGIPLREHPVFRGKQAVDIEKLPGYEVQIGNVWFGSAWKMWFNNVYYQFISKECIENFDSCYRNEEISDTCRCITLYLDVFDYSDFENRKRQWKFKEEINFKETVTKLKEIDICKNIDPHMEIFNGQFEHGGVKLIKIYLDENENCISFKKASKVRIEEYNQKGVLVWKKQELFERMD